MILTYCSYCDNEADGAMLVMGNAIAHADCVIRKLNELLDPDFGGAGEPSKIVGFLNYRTGAELRQSIAEQLAKDAGWEWKDAPNKGVYLKEAETYIALMPSPSPQALYKIVASHMEQFIDEYRVDVRKPLTWEELTDDKRAFWVREAQRLDALSEKQMENRPEFGKAPNLILDFIKPYS